MNLWSEELWARSFLIGLHLIWISFIIFITYKRVTEQKQKGKLAGWLNYIFEVVIAPAGFGILAFSFESFPDAPFAANFACVITAVYASFCKTDKSS